MYCYKAEDRQCATTVEIRAADGTTCGNRKWCQRGECVYDTDAPQNTGNHVCQSIFQEVILISKNARFVTQR